MCSFSSYNNTFKRIIKNLQQNRHAKPIISTRFLLRSQHLQEFVLRFVDVIYFKCMWIRQDKRMSVSSTYTLRRLYSTCKCILVPSLLRISDIHAPCYICDLSDQATFFHHSSSDACGAFGGIYGSAWAL